MNRPSSPSVWPVIHLASLDQALANADIAQSCGCDGVFVIEMQGNDDAVDPVALSIKKHFPKLRVGVNYLSMRPQGALARSIELGMDATWTDNPGVRSDGVRPEVEGLIVPLLKEHPSHLFFGSVAFKYQPIDDDPATAAARAIGYGMIPTTSGTRTGVPPDASKLCKMRSVIGAGPLAVASGIDPENVSSLGRFLTHILVSTGISSSFHEFDPARLRLLMSELGSMTMCEVQ